MLWDFNTFKYSFLKLARVPFDEQALEDDFHRFADYLLGADCNLFHVSGFQTRQHHDQQVVNLSYWLCIRWKKGFGIRLAPWLYQAKAGIPEEVKTRLLDHYLSTVEKYIPVNREQFIKYYYGYVLIRCIQTFGTYGFRGLFERKEHFLQSIPFALRNVEWVLDHVQFPLELPELTRALRHLINAKQFEPFDKSKGASSLLTVAVNSFSIQSKRHPGRPQRQWRRLCFWLSLHPQSWQVRTL